MLVYDKVFFFFGVCVKIRTQEPGGHMLVYDKVSFFFFNATIQTAQPFCPMVVYSKDLFGGG